MTAVPLSTHQHIQPLFEGPVDIVGDIHGEIGALEALLARLGYSLDGRHPAGRRLVFLGDLVDRGEDSPAVVECVAEMVVAGRAQCVLGNHELNLLRREHKEGNGWFWPEEADHDRATGNFKASARATSRQRDQFLAWFDTLPVALERPDLRVVHACWDRDAMDRLRRSGLRPSRAYDAFDDEIAAALESNRMSDRREHELAEWGDHLHDARAPVPMLAGVAAIDTLRQSGHPLRAATSGLERPAPAPFFAAGKWRMNERVAWWEEYEESPAVVFGHYWRRPEKALTAGLPTAAPDLFGGAEPFQWLGPRRNAMCVDWCVGLRWRERLAGAKSHGGKLGALRWNEGEIVLDS